jgi:multiple sugar transport system substrate-binding protein
MSDIAGELHDPPVPPPPGASTFQAIMERYVENVQFGKATPEAAAKSLYDEAKAQIKS